MDTLERERDSRRVDFVEYEKRTNKFLQRIADDPEITAIVQKEAPDGRHAILVPQNVQLEDVEITPEFVRTHIVVFDNSGISFDSLNGVQGSFSDNADAVFIKNPEKGNGPPQLKIFLMRQMEILLESTGKPLNVFITADVIRLKWPNKDESLQNRPPLKPKPTGYQFQDFVEKMRNKKAKDIVTEIKGFIESVHNGSVDTTDLPTKVRDFLTTIHDKLHNHPLWKNATPEELENAGEGLEKYVMSRLWTKVFSPSVEDVQQDVQLDHRFRAFQDIGCTHLEINPAMVQHEAWNDAVQELRRMNAFHSPRDKLICLTNCCKIIFNILRVLEPDKAHGADDFLPCLLLLGCKANPPHLHSNLQYIQDYRNPQHLASEAGYFFTTMQSVVYFWEHVDAESLRIPQDVFEKKLQQCTDPTSNGSNLEGGLSGTSGVLDLAPVVCPTGGSSSEPNTANTITNHDMDTITAQHDEPQKSDDTQQQTETGSDKETAAEGCNGSGKDQVEPNNDKPTDDTGDSTKPAKETTQETEKTTETEDAAPPPSSNGTTTDHPQPCENTSTTTTTQPQNSPTSPNTEDNQNTNNDQTDELDLSSMRTEGAAPVEVDTSALLPSSGGGGGIGHPQTPVSGSVSNNSFNTALNLAKQFQLASLSTSTSTSSNNQNINTFASLVNSHFQQRPLHKQSIKEPIQHIGSVTLDQLPAIVDRLNKLLILEKQLMEVQVKSSSTSSQPSS